MRLIITAGRILKAGWRHFIRNIWLSFTTIFVLILALLSVNVLVGVSALLDTAAKVLENKVDVSVYFDIKTPGGVLEQARFYMAGLPQVQSATVLTAEDAIKNFRSIHARDEKIMAALGELDTNPLGSTMVLKANHSSDYPFILEALKNPQFSDFVQGKNYQDHADAIARVREISDTIRIFGLVLIAIFALFSVLIVYNTIRVAIYTQREEIGIMRLVGASSSYVRMPFVLEGIFLACIAIMLTSIVVYWVALYIDPRLVFVFDGQSPGLGIYFKAHAVQLIVGEGGTLMALVALSSWAAVGTHLKK